MCDRGEVFADVGADVAVHDLRVVDVEQQLHSRRIHPPAHIHAPGKAIEDRIGAAEVGVGVLAVHSLDADRHALVFGVRLDAVEEDGSAVFPCSSPMPRRSPPTVMMFGQPFAAQRSISSCIALLDRVVELGTNQPVANRHAHRRRHACRRGRASSASASPGARSDRSRGSRGGPPRGTCRRRSASGSAPKLTRISACLTRPVRAAGRLRAQRPRPRPPRVTVARNSLRRIIRAPPNVWTLWRHS